MEGILADINIQGHVEILRLIWEGSYWREMWTGLGLSVFSFSQVGLDPEDPDNVVWAACQQRHLCLITANRNQDGPDSLETTIRQQGQINSLPVFTLSDPESIRRRRTFAERVAEKLLDFFLEIEQYRGAGRLYVP